MQMSPSKVWSFSFAKAGWRHAAMTLLPFDASCLTNCNERREIEVNLMKIDQIKRCAFKFTYFEANAS
jgi:hypothetical protein